MPWNYTLWTLVTAVLSPFTLVVPLLLAFLRMYQRPGENIWLPLHTYNLNQDGVWRCFQHWATLGMIKHSLSLSLLLAHTHTYTHTQQLYTIWWILTSHRAAEVNIKWINLCMCECVCVGVCGCVRLFLSASHITGWLLHSGKQGAVSDSIRNYNHVVRLSFLSTREHRFPTNAQMKHSFTVIWL